MRITISIWIFYKKLIIPTLITSIVMGALGPIVMGTLDKGLNYAFLVQNIGMLYIVLTPLFQYFIYEINNPGEYYFYYNMGLSKLHLWIATFLIGLIIGLTLIVI